MYIVTVLQFTLKNNIPFNIIITCWSICTNVECHQLEKSALAPSGISYDNKDSV